MKYFIYSKRLVSAIAIGAICLTGQAQLVEQSPLNSLSGVVAIVQKLTAPGVTALTLPIVEEITGIRLKAPDTYLPPEVLEQLKKLGIQPPTSPRYVEGFSVINSDIGLHVQFASPNIFIELRPTLKLPDVQTQEAMNEHMKRLEIFQLETYQKYCISKNTVFQVLETNDWKFRKSELTMEKTEDTGNFEFIRSNKYAMTTFENNCFQELAMSPDRIY